MVSKMRQSLTNVIALAKLSPTGLQAVPLLATSSYLGLLNQHKMCTRFIEESR